MESRVPVRADAAPAKSSPAMAAAAVIADLRQRPWARSRIGLGAISSPRRGWLEEQRLPPTVRIELERDHFHPSGVLHLEDRGLGAPAPGGDRQAAARSRRGVPPGPASRAQPDQEGPGAARSCCGARGASCPTQGLLPFSHRLPARRPSVSCRHEGSRVPRRCFPSRSSGAIRRPKRLGLERKSARIPSPARTPVAVAAEGCPGERSFALRLASPARFAFLTAHPALKLLRLEGSHEPKTEAEPPHAAMGDLNVERSLKIGWHRSP